MPRRRRGRPAGGGEARHAARPRLRRRAPEAFSFEADGPPGFDRELLEGFARLHRVRLEPIAVKRFGDIIPRLKAGDGDLISSGSSNRLVFRYYGQDALDILGCAPER